MAKNQMSNIAKGLGIGMAVGGAMGGAMGVVGGALRSPRYQRTAKKGLNKVVKTVTSVLDAIA